MNIVKGPLPKRETVIAVRELFVQLGGDLTKKTISPSDAPMFSRQPMIRKNTRLMQYIQPAYDPNIDDIAVERALQGDGEVIDRLTAYEHREFIARLDKLRALWDEDRRASSEWDPELRTPQMESSEGAQRFGKERWARLLVAMDSYRQSEVKRAQRAA